jgi:nucleotide-binding universal stress UspA family protein
MFQHILVPLDGSKLAEVVVPYAQALAARMQASITLLQVVPPPHEVRPSVGLNPEATAHSYLGAVQAHLHPVGLTVEIVTRAGLPADVIVDYAAESGADLIAMSTHGRSGLSRWVYGSVADKVLQGAEVPVLLIRASQADMEAEPPARVVDYQRILIPLDGSALAEGALPYAEALATHFGAHLILVQVPVLPTYAYASTELAYSIEPEMNAATNEATAYLANLAARLVQRGLSVESVVEWGAVAETIIDYAQGHGVGLIVMSTHGRSGLGRWVYGSVANRVLCGADVPVLLVRATLT